MVKRVSLMFRRPGMSMADFRAYDEERHIPLVTRLLPPAQDYRRNDAVEGETHRSAHAAAGRPPAERLFDVLTELTYASPVAEDEERFLDRTTMRSYVVEEFRSV